MQMVGKFRLWAPGAGMQGCAAAQSRDVMMCGGGVGKLVVHHHVFFVVNLNHTCGSIKARYRPIRSATDQRS